MGLKKLLEVLPLFTQKVKTGSFFTVGKKVLIRTVTYHLIGEILEVSDSEIILKDGSWVADSGRFGEAITSGKFGDRAEIEYVGQPFMVSRGAVIDAYEWVGELPKCTQ